MVLGAESASLASATIGTLNNSNGALPMQNTNRSPRHLLPRLLSRRKALAGLVAGTGALVSTRLIASDAPQLAEDDPQAKALGYKHDAAAVDTNAFPKKAAAGGDSQICGNCTLYTDDGSDWGPCSIFPGKLVAKAGWCNVWAAKH